MKQYKINEMFYSLQGEGARSGTANIFIRFALCNLDCHYCDTDFDTFRRYTPSEIRKKINELSPNCKNIIFTGGEPLLQLDKYLIDYLKAWNFFLALETNGTISPPDGIDYITVSPKLIEKEIIHIWKNREIDEYRYVIKAGQKLPSTEIKAKHYYLSPMNHKDRLNQVNVQWCINLIKENPLWKLSSQNHKVWKIR